MTGPIHFKPLSSGDADRIAALQKQGFAPHLQEDVSEIAAILKNTEEHLVCNYSFGLFDGGHMVGYLFAYVESESLFHEREEEVIYVKEVVLSKGYESYLYSMFLKLMEQRDAFSPNLPFEAHAEPASLQSWERLKRGYRRYGLTLQSRVDLKADAGMSYHLLRWEQQENTANIRANHRKLSLASTSDTEISVTLIKDVQQWSLLKPVWDDLLRQTDDYTVFQSFDYLFTWWRNFGQWNELRIFVFHRGDTVVGVSPLMLTYFTNLRKVFRQLIFITASMEMSRPKLIIGSEPETCQALLIDHLHEHRDSWDCLAIEEQLSGRATTSLATALSAEGYFVAQTKTLCPYIELQGSWENFTKSLSKRMRSNISRLRRKLADKGTVEIHLIDDWPELRVAMEQFDDIEENSWKFARNLHIADDKEHYYFYQQLAELFGTKRQFQMRQLVCDEEILSSTFGILYDGVFQSLKIAHRSNYDKLSPGTILESYEIEQLFQSEVRKYEFMGSFLTNKLRWTNDTYETDNLLVFQRQPQLVVIYYLFFVLKPQLKTFLIRIGLFENVKMLVKRISSRWARYKENH